MLIVRMKNLKTSSGNMYIRKHSTVITFIMVSENVHRSSSSFGN